jgi:hypothetical protein
MSVSIPRRKADVLRDYHRNGRGQELPALNVKDHGPGVAYTIEALVAHYGCTPEVAEAARDNVYESEREQFWEYDALDLINYCMLGGREYDGRYKPTGLEDGPYRVMCDGRSGGWLIVEGLPPVSEWDGPTFQKWRKYARLIKETMEFKRTLACAIDLIDANEWCPKAETVAGNRRAARLTPTARLAQAALAIHGELNGTEWSPDTINRCADHLRAAGLAIAEPEQEDRYVATA